MRFCCLRQKEVVNVLEGKSLGFISDLVIDDCTGQICALVVPDNCGIRSFFKCKEFVIPWRCICKIGEDVILVEADVSVTSVRE